MHWKQTSINDSIMAFQVNLRYEMVVEKTGARKSAEISIWNKWLENCRNRRRCEGAMRWIPDHDITITFKFGDFFELWICYGDWNANWQRKIDSTRHFSYLYGFIFYFALNSIRRNAVDVSAWKMHLDVFVRKRQKASIL